MSALLDSLASSFRGDDSRRQALDAALRDGLPGPRSEAWKYTSLRALERRQFNLATDSAVDTNALDARLATIPSPRMVFVDGRFDAGRSLLGDLPKGVDAQPLSQLLANGTERDSNFLQRAYTGADAVFATLNSAFARDGAVIRCETDCDDTTLHLVYATSAATSDAATHLRHMIDLRNDASVRVTEHHIALGEHRGLCNHVCHIHLGQRARLTHVRLQDEATGNTSFVRTDAVLARDADYRRVDLELGSALSRHELNVRLEGEAAKLRADGVLLADGRRHVDTRLGIDHIARDTACALNWRGLAGQRGKAVFHGGILIRAGADGTAAELSNKNLLLSADAEVDTQPVLEIHADEVQAAHGATVGQLDATALFYLRSRGLDEAAARRLLTTAFCREVVASIEDEPTRVLADAALDAALARLGA